MNIVEKIRQSISGGAGVEVLYQSEQGANIQLEYRTSFPLALVYLINTGNVEAGGQVVERVNLSVFFIKPTQWELDSVENEEIIDECKKSANRWIASLKRDPYFSVIGEIRTQRVYDEFDLIVTGYGVQITLQEQYGYNACTDDERPIIDTLHIDENGVYDVRSFLNVSVNVPQGIDVYEKNDNLCWDRCVMDEDNIIIEHKTDEQNG